MNLDEKLYELEAKHLSLNEDYINVGNEQKKYIEMIEYLENLLGKTTTHALRKIIELKTNLIPLLSQVLIIDQNKLLLLAENARVFHGTIMRPPEEFFFADTPQVTLNYSEKDLGRRVSTAKRKRNKKKQIILRLKRRNVPTKIKEWANQVIAHAREKLAQLNDEKSQIEEKMKIIEFEMRRMNASSDAPASVAAHASILPHTSSMQKGQVATPALPSSFSVAAPAAPAATAPAAPALPSSSSFAPASSFAGRSSDSLGGAKKKYRKKTTQKKKRKKKYTRYKNKKKRRNKTAKKHKNKSNKKKKKKKNTRQRILKKKNRNKKNKNNKKKNKK